MRKIALLAFCSASAIAVTNPGLAKAQTTGADPDLVLTDSDEQDFVTDDPLVEESDAVDTIIVTARRREESVQEVPIVINTVSAEDIAQLNLRDFQEISSVVPGLGFTNQGFSGGASIRGLSFDTRVSGNNATVEFYVNDTPINGGAVLQQMYDIAQIEVLRGPQGTLRGRASPSGAITITTRQADLYDIGGNISMTANDIGTQNFNGGIGVPIIEGVAAIRVAGLYNVGDADEVRTIAPLALDSRDPYNRSSAVRLSAVLQPTDWLRLEGVYQLLDTTFRRYPQIESANIADPTQPASPRLIRGEDRLSLVEAPSTLDQRFDLYTWKGELSFAGQNLIYVGNYRKQNNVSTSDADAANRFPGFAFGQTTDSNSSDEAHELRLQNEERVAGLFDYVVGVFDQNNNSPTDLINQTVVALPGFLGGGIATVVDTPISRIGASTERSYFGNLTFYVGDKFEISGGARYIEIESEGALIISGNRIPDPVVDDNKLIYTASANYFISPDIMVYASTGTSYRSSPTAIGDFSRVKSALQQSFTTLPPEESTNYEIGLKSTLFNRLRFNTTAFYQKFQNYPYRSPGVFYQNFSFVNGALAPSVGQFNFVAAVPVEVKGVEVELGMEITPNWDFGLVAAYADGQIQDGLIPCNDLNGDGVPDQLTTTPTLAQVQAAYGANNLGACTVSQRSGFQSPFSATLQSEYSASVTRGVDAFGRGLFSFFGKSRNDPQNQFDDVGDYGLLNLYTGIRDPEGMWEVSLFAKNVLDEQRVLDRNLTPNSTGFQELQPPTFRTTSGVSVSNTYRGIGYTAPREFGLNVRFAFGSR